MVGKKQWVMLSIYIVPASSRKLVSGSLTHKPRIESWMGRRPASPPRGWPPTHPAFDSGLVRKRSGNRVSRTSLNYPYAGFYTTLYSTSVGAHPANSYIGTATFIVVFFRMKNRKYFNVRLSESIPVFASPNLAGARFGLAKTGRPSDDEILPILRSGKRNNKVSSDHMLHWRCTSTRAVSSEAYGHC